MRNLILFVFIVVLFSCKKEIKKDLITEKVALVKIIKKYGYTYNDYKVIEDTIRKDESFGEILYRNHIDFPEIHKIVEVSKDSFNIRNLRVGKPYTILAKKDTTEKAQIFIYQPNKVEYLIIDFKDSIRAQLHRKPIKIVIKTATGTIKTSLSEAMDEAGLNYGLVNEMSDIYAWAIDFFHLQKEDSFKVIYEEKFIDDTTSVGIGIVKAAYFKHKNTPFYAFRYITDSTKNIADYYDDKANTLRRQFLRAPLQFSRITSRYNLRRYIRYYGRRKPHRGTDFAAAVGTPIMATANGTVIASARRGGNGNYVKIRHNSTYTTQYLHMQRRKVKKGDYVKQGDIIGTVGMTGNTSGPHVCYRFWKNGTQVDPFRQKLPSAKPIKKELKETYLNFINPLKMELDQIPNN